MRSRHDAHIMTHVSEQSGKSAEVPERLPLTQPYMSQTAGVILECEGDHEDRVTRAIVVKGFGL